MMVASPTPPNVATTTAITRLPRGNRSDEEEGEVVEHSSSSIPCSVRSRATIGGAASATGGGNTSGFVDRHNRPRNNPHRAQQHHHAKTINPKRVVGVDHRPKPPVPAPPRQGSMRQIISKMNNGSN
eukprot:CAMPEP_0201965888 /NCGR_PEP_ID=MMETSP0904-20121228/11048_1 /ASSEMBLY_ACC=CAM_ASM_000553 /TAXON_ID=420261 /ORGANISM="Thalassiosira antarctica, Strain CCMP982" /LENGTH=126 /DNA_ID=CAMNT_0048513025 /DNA_START=544 /DNA_END=921 /DNA_ORIENTATION=+